MLRLSGPAKDFFNVELTPSMINKEYHSMTFHYPKRLENKTYLADEIIKNLL